MPSVRPFPYQINFVGPSPRRQLTHFLCFPLVTPTSRPQLQASLQRLTTEVTTPTDSGKAILNANHIRPVGSIRMSLGAMSLLSRERVDAACTYLRSLDIRSMLSAASVSTIDKVDVNSAGSPAPPTALSEPAHMPPPEAPPPPPQPLITSLSGLYSPIATSSGCLYAPLTSSSPHLRPFVAALRDAFTTAGILVPEKQYTTLCAPLVKTLRVRLTVGGKKRWVGNSFKFDATALIERYRDVEWATDVRIERVAICELGLKEVRGGKLAVDHAYKEIASVELP